MVAGARQQRQTGQGEVTEVENRVRSRRSQRYGVQGEISEVSEWSET